jgi:DNA polymerase-3 subunit gamma/tau
VKFLFATTEIRKVPVTVLSRCQRFDLRRIEPEVMIAHLQQVAAKEGAQIADDALALITRAAEGSVRDAMSLLDQAIAHGAGETTATQVRAMLGLADRGRVLDLFEAIMRGDAAGALSELGGQYADGADPVAVLRDLAEITHWLSVVKITSEAAEDPTVAPEERIRGRALADRLPMRVLTRMWQMLLKALEEVAVSPNAMMAAEMAVIRLTHVADLPTPGDLVKKLQSSPPPTGGGGGVRGSAAMAPSAAPRAQVSAPRGGGGGGAVQAALQQAPGPDLSLYPSFASVVALIEETRDIKLLIEVKNCLRLISYAPGRMEFQLTDDAPPDLVQRLKRALQLATGANWIISLANEGGAPTIAEQDQAASRAIAAELERHPLLQAVKTAFPKARIAAIRTRAELLAAAQAEALPELPDSDDLPEDWDPFEDE